MKMNLFLFSALVALTATGALAQDKSSTGAQSPAPAVPQYKRPVSIKKRVEINPPAMALVKGVDVNVRGQPSFIGEVLGHLQTGATVTVMEEVTLNHPATDEPPTWYKILMPANYHVWVKADYIDEATKSVKVRRVNLRGGPGENFSIVGRLEKGDMINELRGEKGWAMIEAPSNAYAFVATELIEIEPTPAPEVVVVPPPAAAELAPAVPIAPAPTPQSEADQELAALHQATAPETPTPAATAAPAPAEAATPRTVTREGFVHKSYNVQSPTDFELHDIKSGALTEYLEPKDKQTFKIFVGTRVSVTGPESIDKRWPRTPVLQVESVDLLP
jgi:hypothetical protein